MKYSEFGDIMWEVAGEDVTDSFDWIRESEEEDTEDTSEESELFKKFRAASTDLFRNLPEYKHARLKKIREAVTSFDCLSEPQEKELNSSCNAANTIINEVGQKILEAMILWLQGMLEEATPKPASTN